MPEIDFNGDTWEQSRRRIGDRLNGDGERLDKLEFNVSELTKIRSEFYGARRTMAILGGVLALAFAGLTAFDAFNRPTPGATTQQIEQLMKEHEQREHEYNSEQQPGNHRSEYERHNHGDADSIPEDARVP